MKILNATVVCGKCTDECYLSTDLPEATFPYTEKLAIRFDAAKGSGIDYIRKHLAPIMDENGVIVEIKYSGITINWRSINVQNPTPRAESGVNYTK